MTCDEFRETVEFKDPDDSTTAVVAAVWDHGTECGMCRKWFDEMILRRAGGNLDIVALAEKMSIPGRLECLSRVLNDPETQGKVLADLAKDPNVTIVMVPNNAK